MLGTLEEGKGLSPGNLAITADRTLGNRTHEDRGALAGALREALAVGRADEATRRTPGVVGLLATVAVAVTSRRAVGVTSGTLGTTSKSRRARRRTESQLSRSGAKGHGVSVLGRVAVVEDRAGHGGVGVVGAVGGARLARAGGRVGRRAGAGAGAKEVSVPLALEALGVDGSLDGGAGLGEVDVLAFNGLTLARAVHVSDEDGREAVEALGVGGLGG